MPPPENWGWTKRALKKIENKWNKVIGHNICAYACIFHSTSLAFPFPFAFLGPPVPLCATILCYFYVYLLHSITTLCSLADNQHCCRATPNSAHFPPLGACYKGTVCRADNARAKNANCEWRNEVNGASNDGMNEWVSDCCWEPDI